MRTKPPEPTEQHAAVLEAARALGGDVAAAFAALYVGREVPDDVDPEVLAREAVELLAFAARRDQPVAVRAFTPELARDGYATTGSVVECATDDLPFLVDSAMAAVAAHGHAVAQARHPIVGIERDEDGRAVAVQHAREATQRESVMHLELDRPLDDSELMRVAYSVREALADVGAAVRDAAAMRFKVERLAELAGAGDADPEEIEQIRTFLRWLADGMFVFLGYREWKLGAGGERTLVDHLGLSPDEDDDRPDGLGTLVVGKVARVSTVQRRAPMDVVAVRALGREAALLGLWAPRVTTEPASRTPLLARKLRAIQAGLDLIEGSHDHRTAAAIFDSFPKDELFAASADDLGHAIATLLATPPGTIAVLARVVENGTDASVVVALPRARHDAETVARIADELAAALGADPPTVHEVLESARARLHFAVHAPDGLRPLDRDALRARIVTLTRGWDDRLADVLGDGGRALGARWAPLLPDAYKVQTSPELAAGDLHALAELERSGEPLLARLQDDRSARTSVRLYSAGSKRDLSHVMPVLEDLGLYVVSEIPTEIGGSGDPDGDGDGPHVWIQDFRVVDRNGAALELAAVGDRVAETIIACSLGRAESDSLNGLVIAAGLRFDQVEVLRAYRRYRQRLGSRFTEGYQNTVIVEHAELTAKIMRLFELRFDPAQPRDEAAEEALRAEILVALEAIPSVDSDLIMRNQLAVVEATVRTNAYKPGRGPLAFKLRGADVPAIPLPAPEYEVYVHDADMEGTHLRGGLVARGGIRWSDRMDYRTEVFGLMRAQMVKNAVIVPTGAKGGFFLKRRPADPGELREEGRRQYARYVGALLDITDDRRDGTVVRPAGVRALDGEDPYLVVAADKGTATFSDLANSIALERGFWLGDAFASGGSNGYDHKALGITARGAWESVKRHFLDLGVDPERDPVTVVGIGDMSGDVFGNGMLLSRSLKLVAAYDHRHVFLDPDPDPERSYAERARLFALAGSSWDDFDRSVLSEGGGVWSRSLKRVPVTPQVRAALGITATELAPTELIRAVLRAPVDLLWNGGIGTVVRASAESDADALDRSSDAIRVTAAELRARVIGEGGNLGLTQRARVEFARRGGGVNADFIDNSAGVDCSDHEVNLKILLAQPGGPQGPERDTLLRDVTDDVTAHVLADSYRQAQSLALESGVAATRTEDYEDLIGALEARGVLDRAIDRLPSPDELQTRRAEGEGLSRPELAVLLAHGKRDLAEALLASPLLDDPWLEHDLRAYFPARVVERYGELVPSHPLRRQILSTLLSNLVLDRLGPAYVQRLVSERGAAPDEVVRATRIAVEVVGARERWARIEALGSAIDTEGRLRLHGGVAWVVEAIARWFLAEHPGIDVGTAIADYAEGIARIGAAMDELRSEEWRTDRERETGELVAAGVPEDLAHAAAITPALVHAPDAVAVARGTARDAVEAARALFATGDGLRLESLELAILSLPSTTRVKRWAAQALLDDVLDARRYLAAAALEAGQGLPAEAAVAEFLAAQAGRIERLERIRRGLTLGAGDDLAGLGLAVRQLVRLALPRH